MKKIVFVNPPPPKGENELWESAGPKTPPLGLLNLAAITRESGYETSILDAEALGLDVDTAVEKILNSSPNYVGITATTIFIKNAQKIAEKIKQKNKDIKILIGGAHLTALPEKTMENSSFDIGVIGEGEITLIDLLSALDNNEELDEIRGLIFIKDNHIIKTEPRPLIHDLDILPMPAWDLLPEIKKHYRAYAQSADKFPSFSVITSRGCIGQCIFCDRAIFGNQCRAHSAEYVFKMMQTLNENYGIKNIIFEDDLFTIFRERINKLSELIKKNNLEISWSVCSRVDTVNPEILKEMKQAGCWQILYGIESGSQRVLDFIKKKITLEQVTKAIKLTKEAGLHAKGFFILGHPTETKESIEQTLNFIKKSQLDDFSVSFFTPFPGSEIYTAIHAYGEVDEDWDKMNAFEPVFIPNGFTKKQLYSYSKRAYRSFYFKPKVMFNYIKRLKNPKQALFLVKGGIGLLKYLVKR